MSKNHTIKFNQSVFVINGKKYLNFCGDFLLWRKRKIKVGTYMTGEHLIRDGVVGETVIDVLGEGE